MPFKNSLQRKNFKISNQCIVGHSRCSVAVVRACKLYLLVILGQVIALAVDWNHCCGGSVLTMHLLTLYFVCGVENKPIYFKT